MAFEQIAQQMRDNTREQAFKNRLKPVGVTSEDTFEFDGEQISVIFKLSDFPINGKNIRCWQLSVTNEQGEHVKSELVYKLIQEFFGGWHNVREIPKSFYAHKASNIREFLKPAIEFLGN